MKKILFSGILFFLLIIPGCSSGFCYPDKNDFVLEATISQPPYRSDEAILFQCSFTNKSGKDYFIHNGSQAITYSADGSEEARELIAISTPFSSNDQITRQIEISPLTVGYHKVEIKCPIEVTPEQFSDGSENSKEYIYSKTLEIEVYK